MTTNVFPGTSEAPPAFGAPDTALARDTERFTHLLTEFMRAVQFRDRDRACCHGVSVSQCYALRALILEGPLSVNELAAQLYLDKSTASRVAAGLERLGLAERRRAPEDRRLVRLHATDEGRRRFARIEADLRESYGALLATLDPRARRPALELLERLVDAVTEGVEIRGGRCCTSSTQTPITHQEGPERP